MESQAAKPAGGRSPLLSLVAIAVAVVALVLAVAYPAASPGAAPGTVEASHSILSLASPVPVGTTCSHYAGAQVTISVTSAGDVVVSASTVVRINHTTAAETAVDIYISDSSSSCANSGWTATATIAASQPTDSYIESVGAQRSFAVSGAGAHTFFLNGVFIDGDSGGAAHWFSAALVAVFHPRA